MDDSIKGTIEILNDSSVEIQLQNEHGGCWNVQHFADEPINFKLEENQNWIQIQFVVLEKAYFHSEKSVDKKQKAYIIKNDFVCVNKIEGNWAHCTYLGERITEGWIRTECLNKI